jgi:hypothetical protein
MTKEFTEQGRKSYQEGHNAGVAHHKQAMGEREWVALSKKQIKKLEDTPTLYSDYKVGRSSFEYLCPYKFAHAVGAKLKELNN